MKLIKEALKIDIYGINNELNYPTLKELENLEKSMNGEDNVETTKKFLIHLGMVPESFDSLQVNHIKQIMESLGGGK
tara:strand:- start:1900 stop:2130 length:231 start_codon:yes stop_codon:yes gene_type:complete